LKDLYCEGEKEGNSFREEYLNAVNALVKNRREEADKKRSEYINPDSVCESREKYRCDFINMLGWPLNAQMKREKPNIKQHFVSKDSLGSIYRLQLEVLDGLWFYGILFVPDESKKQPLVISQHGGEGTPELCSGFFGSEAYNDMTRRVLSTGAAVFAPQLLLWRKDFGPEFDRIKIDAQLKQAGGSITALEIYSITRCIDYLSELSYIDSDKIGMIGVSYGGFYSLFTAAADTRIKAVYSSCFFNNRYVYDWTDWTWFDAAFKFLDAEVGALICPRPLYIEVGENDELFVVQYAKEEFKRIKEYYVKAKAENSLQFKIFKGGHELDRDNDGIEFLINSLK